MENPVEKNVRKVVASERGKVIQNPQILEKQSIGQLGQEQPIQKKKVSWWIWLIVVLVLICIIGGFYLFFF